MALLLKSGELSEHSIHQTVMQWVHANRFTKVVLHFPNEGARTGRFGKNLQSKGMRKGVSDLLIAMPRHGFNGAWIELKSTNGVVKKEQKEFLIDMQEQNYFTAITWSLDEALFIFQWYCLSKEWKQGDLWASPNRHRTSPQHSPIAPHGMPSLF